MAGKGKKSAKSSSGSPITLVVLIAVVVLFAVAALWTWPAVNDLQDVQGQLASSSAPVTTTPGSSAPAAPVGPAQVAAAAAMVDYIAPADLQAKAQLRVLGALDTAQHTAGVTLSAVTPANLTQGTAPALSKLPVSAHIDGTTADVDRLIGALSAAGHLVTVDWAKTSGAGGVDVGMTAWISTTPPPGG